MDHEEMFQRAFEAACAEAGFGQQEQEDEEEDDDSYETILEMERRRGRRKKMKCGGGGMCSPLPVPVSWVVIALLLGILFLQVFDVRLKGETDQTPQTEPPKTGAPAPPAKWRFPILSELREREAAIEKVASSWWTSAFIPDAYQTLIAMRAAPYGVFGGLITAFAQVTGHPDDGGDRESSTGYVA